MNTIQLWMLASGVVISVMTSAALTADRGNLDTRLTWKMYFLDTGCSLLSLASSFPLLYPNRSDATIPGVPGLLDADVYLNTSTFRLGINLTFNAPVVGNLSSFKGFEIMYHRSDNLTKSCWIFNMSDSDFMAGNIKTLFNLYVQPAKKDSTYFFEVSSLPKPAMLSEPHQTLKMNVFVLNYTAGSGASNWSTYIKFINDSQKQEVWVEFREPPASFEFSKFEVKLYPVKLGEMQTTIISGTGHTFSNVKPGLYTIKIKPNDTFTNSSLCKCCINNLLQHCMTSETTPFYMHEVDQISTRAHLSSTDSRLSSFSSRPVSFASSTYKILSSSVGSLTTIQKTTTPRTVMNSKSVSIDRTTLTISLYTTLLSYGAMPDSTTSSTYYDISTKIDNSSTVSRNQGDMTLTYVIIGCASGVVLAVLVVTVSCLRNGRSKDLKESKPDPIKKETKLYEENDVNDDIYCVEMLDTSLKIKSNEAFTEHANQFGRKNVFLVFAEDHNDHLTVVDNFACFLQYHCFCNIVYAPYHAESLERDGLITSMQHSLENADCILIINSAALYTICNAEKCRKKLRSRPDSYFANILRMTIHFVMSKVAENPTCRVANLLFEHTPNEYVMPDLSANFLLLKQFKELLYYIHEIKDLEDARKNFEYLEIGTLSKTDNWQFLCNAIQQTWLFEHNNPSWLSQRFRTEESDIIGRNVAISKEVGKCPTDTTLDLKDQLLDALTRESRMIPLCIQKDTEEDKQSKTISEQMVSINEHYRRKQYSRYGNTNRLLQWDEEVTKDRKCTRTDNYCTPRETNSSSPDDFIPPDDYFQEDVHNGNENHTETLCRCFHGNRYSRSEIHNTLETEWRHIEDNNLSLGGYSV